MIGQHLNLFHDPIYGDSVVPLLMSPRGGELAALF